MEKGRAPKELNPEAVRVCGSYLQLKAEALDLFRREEEEGTLEKTRALVASNLLASLVPSGEKS